MVKSTNAKEEKKVSSENFDIEKQDCVQKFDNWSETDQVDFVEYLLARMCHYQHGQINTFLKPMLQRDFISALPGKKIFLILFAVYCTIYAMMSFSQQGIWVLFEETNVSSKIIPRSNQI